MKSVIKLFVIVWSLSVCTPFGRLAAQTSTPAAQLVRLEMHTSAEDLAFLDGEPVLLLGVRPRDGVHRVQLRDKQGRVLWEHTLGKGERLGGAMLSSDGKHLVYDYFVHETTRGWLAPHEPVTYRGGVRCVRWDGSIAWDHTSRGISEGPPTYSPEGRVEQVAGGKVLILRYGWESVRQVTVRDLSGRQRWQQELQGATAATLSPDGSHLFVSSQTLDANWTRIYHTDGRLVTHLVGASLPYSYPLASWSSRKYLVVRGVLRRAPAALAQRG